MDQYGGADEWQKPRWMDQRGFTETNRGEMIRCCKIRGDLWADVISDSGKSSLINSKVILIFLLPAGPARDGGGKIAALAHRDKCDRRQIRGHRRKAMRQ